MIKRILGTALSAGLGFTFLVAPASATTTASSSVSVAVTAATQATIGVAYSSGSAITCAVGTSVSGSVACSTTATVSGTIRSTYSNASGSQVAITGAAITGSGGSSIPASAFSMSCTGGTIGSPTYGGTQTLATALALSTSAANCSSWTGTVVSAYNLVLSLSLNSAMVPADTYTTTGFTAAVSTT